MDKLIILDVETPNGRNDKICSIAAITVVDGKIANKYYSLVNPECDFDYKNINIHGISPLIVANSPTFPEVWESIKEQFKSSIIVAHNATFDLCVLKKTLNNYNIDTYNCFYMCTLELSKKYIYDVENNRLDTLCKYFNIELNDHHNALCDCECCYKVLSNMIEKYNISIDDNIHLYDMSKNLSEINHKGSSKETHFLYNEETKSLQTLQGILMGIIGDEVINEKEVILLKKWLDDNQNLTGNYPFDKVSNVINNVLDDGIIDQNELDEMLQLFKKFLNPVESCSCNCDQQIDLYNKIVCLTGEFAFLERNKLEDAITSLGATVKPNVTKKTDYVIVGSLGSQNWSTGNYGNKIKKAMELIDQGCGVQIIPENDFIEALGKGNLRLDPYNIEQIIHSVNDNVILQKDLKQSDVLYKTNSDGSISVLLRNVLMYKIDSKSINSVIIKENTLKQFNLPCGSKSETIKSSNGFNKIIFLPQVNIEDIKKLFAEIIEYNIFNFSTDFFGCCALYESCSNEKKCIHNDKLYATGCFYRRNLENGKIFYGKNKNNPSMT